MRKIVVPKKYNNKKLCNFVLDVFPSLNKNTLFKSLRKKDIRINNVKINSDCIVHENDEIIIYINDELLFNLKQKIDVVYEDDNILVVNKSENLPVTNNSSYATSLSNLVQKMYGNNVNPCHRIDSNTKGLVLFAKNDVALDILTNKFKNEEIEKHYFCKVIGILKEKHKILEAYLFKDSKKSIVYISDSNKKDYSKIITEYTVLKEDIQNNISYLDVNLHTGKTHQIRAHLAHIGHPIIGDGKYGNYETNKKYNLKSQELYSYFIKFNFKTSGGILDYLNNKVIKIENIEKTLV